MSSTGRFDRGLIHHDKLPLPVDVRPIRGARRLRLRIDERRRVLTLTGPWRMDRRLALDWAAGQRAWVDAQIGAMLPDEPFVSGAVIPVEGIDRRIDWREEAPRMPRLEAGRLVCGGPEAGLARRIEHFLKQLALERLSQETAEFAAVARVRPASVAVGDAGTRWGSCSSAGRVRYSWRLILAPVAARRFVVAHEVAHLVHLDHGPEFKRLERDLFGPGLEDAKSLLRAVGPRLKRIGRG